ncbi:MAG: hypothetical protein LBM99_00135 [Bacillales bacterium]|jgi:hypothetical protein|nr:hypothetical protein [Bacillales bacterium]
MKKNLLYILPLLIGCNANNKCPVESSLITSVKPVESFENKEAVSKYNLVAENGRARFETKEGEVIPVISGYLRTDQLLKADFKTPEELEPYFSLAQETNLNFLDIVLQWSSVEINEDEFDFSLVERYLDFAKKYSLKINLIWYGSLVDGESHSANYPNYIFADNKRFSVIRDLFDFGIYGRNNILDWSDPDLLAREQYALYQTMNYVEEWNQNNENYNPVLTVQVGQGADRFQRWRVGQYKVVNPKTNEIFNDIDSWSLVHAYLNEVGKGVKYSSYPAYTRAEFCEQPAVTNYVREIKNLEFIDLVSPTYLQTLSNEKSGISSFVSEYPNMPVLNVENWADDSSYRHLLVNSAMQGSGFTFYTLSNALYYPESPNGAIYHRVDNEVFNSINTRANDIKEASDILLKLKQVSYKAKASNFALFGFDNLISGVQKIYMKDIEANKGLLLDFDADAYGIAIYDNGNLYCASLNDATLTIDNCTIPVAIKGQFEGVSFVNGGNVSLDSNKILNMKAGEVYRVRLTNILDLPSNQVLQTNGYKSINESIRG